MYDEYDYLTVDILNNFENEILALYNDNQEILLTSYIPKKWVIDEFVYVDDIKHIEDAIEYSGKKMSYPNGWQTSKKWSLDEINNISYKDLNRWRNNLDLLFTKAKELELKYSSEFYCGEEVSL